MNTLKLTLACVLALTTACSTAPRTVSSMDMDGEAWESTAVAISYTINKKGCLLRLTNLADDREYDLELDPKKSAAIFEVPEGAYKGVRLSCSTFNSWSLSRFLKKEVELSPGKINYLGYVSMILDSTGKDLQLNFGERAKDMEGAEQVLKLLPAPTRKYLVSAATAKPIREAMTRTHQPWSAQLKISVQRFVQTAEGKQPESQGDRALGQLRAELTNCDQEEQKRYALRIGRQKWVTTYQAGKLEKIDRLLNENAFSDDWTHCVETALGAFQAPENEKIEVTLEL